MRLSRSTIFQLILPIAVWRVPVYQLAAKEMEKQMTGGPFDIQLGFDEFDRAYHAFERKILARQIADIDREIAEAKRDVAKYGNEIDVEIVMHLEITRANWLKYLKHLDQKLKDLEPKASLGEVMIEACGSGEPLIGQSQPRSLPPASSKKPT